MSTSPVSARQAPDTYQQLQLQLIDIGDALGYETRRSFRKSAAGDAIWLDRRGARFGGAPLPVVAFRILTFETAKEIREAIATLQAISPALGVLVVAETAYAARAKRLKKYTETTYPAHIREIAEHLAEGIGLTFRVDVWGEGEIRALYKAEVEGRLRFG